MIKIKHKGDFSKAIKYLGRLKKSVNIRDLEKYGKLGVEALASATPVATGTTARSWFYKIENKDGRISIDFCNNNIQNGVLIAVILQYGHATGTGGWIEGIDYINPTIRPIFDQITKDAWKEVTNL